MEQEFRACDGRCDPDHACFDCQRVRVSNNPKARLAFVTPGEIEFDHEPRVCFEATG